VYGISVDSWYAHAAYHKQLNLPSNMQLLSDFNREVTPLYAGLQDTATGFRGVCRRAVFVIGKDGKVAYRWDNTVPPSIPDVDPVLEAVRALHDAS
jgi:glutaredoxin-dependent peroxiredoxin